MMNFVNDGFLRKALEYDKLAHLGMCCFITCFLYLVTLGVERFRLKRGKEMLPRHRVRQVLCLIVFLGSILLEIYQGYYGHGFSFNDLLANAIGILVAYWATGPYISIKMTEAEVVSLEKKWRRLHEG